MRTRFLRSLARPGIAFRTLPPRSRVALGVLITVLLGAVLAPLITGDPLVTHTPAVPPSAEHWFGTDKIGRDVFTRVVHGARYSLLIGLGATLVALLAGAVLGSLAATSPKWGDEALMRILDVVMAFPPIALALVLVVSFGKSIPVLILTIAFVYTPMLARVVRANVLAQYGEDYVAAEKVIGARRGYIVVKHIAVNCAAPVLVFATVLVAEAIIFEASLSFIGAGVQDPEPSWGSVLNYGREILLNGGWWATMFPGLAILVTVLALNILAEGLTDASAAPAARRRSSGDEPVAEAAEASAPVTAPSTVDDSLAVLARVARTRARFASSVRADAPVLLSVEDLSIRFPDRYGDVAVVDGISFSVREGETLGLVGESGCGKSITSLAITGLLPRTAEVSGRVTYRGDDLLTLPPRQRRALAGPEIAMVYQDALSSLNPSVLVGRQLAQLTRRGGRKTPAELLDLVGLSPKRTLRSYPHELSGGQRQRVLIAMALSREPRLLIADEPTTALDVTVQAQVVELLVRLRDELGFAMVLVSHDLALVGELAHRVAVMYAGQVAELGTTSSVLAAPTHHYTRGLLGSVVSLEAGAPRLHQIRGVVPAPSGFGAGCRFASRCPAATEVCRTVHPGLTGPGEHAFACHHPATVLEGSTR
ncbi:Oligopeptide transport system permease protein OppB (TC 3.A.1.5.1) [Alloactinosynnema sp. L-07]|uniref:dipeptide/oligopeptide/nickel ABC transporter permease/ATP-binding protein n=1 Tax=Alloactinosynnema sp. L-07 TaxID=1653480 RepID=UPI00065F0B73|nr:dipeptide/oligopeptide/nickel ABC transporter permease/ATP-binding protein [Alloactinosynnema sp. L-07]CRK56634.1 Oligopeptide transport system permease protein OppB (TC 3.A.1.5.1) [Alloactinosynnema sp. L-07]